MTQESQSTPGPSREISSREISSREIPNREIPGREVTPGNSNAAAGDIVDVVILIHGIRTRAFWYDLAQPILSEIDGIVVKPLGYDYFSVLRLVFPFLRSGPARKIAEDIRDIKVRYDQQNRRVRLSVVAHSFGTYTIVSLLRQTRDIDLHHLVLCGSVLPSNFDFDSISRKIHGKFVNDAGAKDAWPVLAKIASFGYGASGTFGFQSGLIEDRFHDFAHSDFFNREFIRQYWFPIFDRDQVVHSTFERKPSWRTSLVNLLARLPSGTLLICLVVAALYAAVPPLYGKYRSTILSMLIDQIDNERKVRPPVEPGPVLPVDPKPLATMVSDDEILTRVLRWEGGYSNLPENLGGPTNAGITVAQWTTFSGKPATADTIKNLTRSQIMDFYRENFLQRAGVRDIKNLAVKAAYANMLIQSGPTAATRAFQSGLKDAFQANVPIDGMLGPATVVAINAVNDPDLLIEAATCARLKELKSQPAFATSGTALKARLRDFLPKNTKGLCASDFQ
jgi:pimeloyl-ACP methyl ester carboxylesterase